jgi:two-component system sensor histidine kinase KdpD
VAAPTLVGATLSVWLLENQLGIPDASPVYLVAVVAAALLSGTLGAIVTAVVGILTYDYLFTEPYGTFAISDPGEWLSLALLLFVGLVVGQLAALQRAQTATATTREREARELFGLSRALATRSSTRAALPGIAELLRAATGMRMVSIALGADDAAEREVARAGGQPPGPAAGLLHVLRRAPGSEPAAWVRVHSGPARGQGAAARLDTYRVRIEAGGETLGSIWSVRERAADRPDRSATRLLSAAADQVGQLLVQDRLAQEARDAEIARQSDALKSALLQSVSHDLRTPLAAIRAAAGTLRPTSAVDDEGRAASAATIERQVQHLDRLVSNLLDLGRIEAGALRAELDVFELDDLVGRTVQRFEPSLAGRSVTVDVPPLAVRVDAVLLDQALSNLVDNAIKFAPASAPLRLAARVPDEDFVSLLVEDGGPGVPEALLPRIFDPFYRVRGDRSAAAPSRGTGLGLAVVRGVVEAMGGRVEARRSELGGLAVELSLPAAVVPAGLATARQ